jgi:hypothetical protein
MGNKSTALHQDASSKLSAYIGTLDTLRTIRETVSQEVRTLVFTSPQNRTPTQINSLRGYINQLELVRGQVNANWHQFGKSTLTYYKFLTAKENKYKGKLNAGKKTTLEEHFENYEHLAKRYNDLIIHTDGVLTEIPAIIRDIRLHLGS